MKPSEHRERAGTGPFEFTPVVATNPTPALAPEVFGSAQRDIAAPEGAGHAGKSTAAARGVREWPSTSLMLTRLSFGAADVYSAGGLPVFDDHYPADEPLDIAERGREFFGVLPVDDHELDCVTAAYVVGTERVVVKFWLLADPWLRGKTLTIRARAGDQARVCAREVEIDSRGLAEAEVDVIGLDTSRIGTLDEQWTWEYSRDDRQAFFPVAIESTEPTPFNSDRMIVAEKIPVRIYVKDGGSASPPLPMDSFYHIACSVSGGRGQARDKVWQAFTDFRREPHALQNSRGVPLKFWGDTEPKAVLNSFITRSARDLVVHGDSSCFGWADLLRQAFAIHGIRSRVVGVRPSPLLLSRSIRPPDLTLPDGLGGSLRFMQIGFVLKRFRWASPGPLNPPVAGQYLMDAGDFRWRINLPGDEHNLQWEQQDLENIGRPEKMCRDEGARRYGIFSNHAIVMLEEAGRQTWYDPSYGLGPYDSLAAYEQDLLGFGERDCGGFFGVIGVLVRTEPDPATGRPKNVPAGRLMGACPAVPPGNLVMDELDDPQ